MLSSSSRQGKSLISAKGREMIHGNCSSQLDGAQALTGIREGATNLEVETIVVDFVGGPNDGTRGVEESCSLPQATQRPVSLVGNPSEHRGDADQSAVIASLVEQLKAKDRELALADATIEDMRREITRLEETCERRLGPTWE